MARTGPKPSLDLWEFVPTSPEEMLQLEDRLLKAGVAAGRAARIPMRLYRLWATGIDGLQGSVRVSYRQELSKLDSPPWGWGRAARLAVAAKGAYIERSNVRRLERSARAGYSEQLAA